VAAWSRREPDRVATARGPESLSVGPRPVTVFCTDDQSVFLDVMREVVAATPGLVQIGEAAGSREAVRAVAELRPDLVLMDIRMPALDGFQAAQMMAQRQPSLVVLLLSADPPAPPPGFECWEGQVTLMAKRELCPRALLDLWHGRRPR
jgi:PleD family two-component response regulator